MTDSAKVNFANIIRNLRISEGLSQKEVADKLSVHPKTVGRWERGLILPKGRKLEKLAALFDLSPSSLFHEAREMPEELHLIYCIVSDRDQPDLESRVNEMLQKGWQPQGGVAVRRFGSNEEKLYQSMTKLVSKRDQLRFYAEFTFIYDLPGEDSTYQYDINRNPKEMLVCSLIDQENTLQSQINWAKSEGWEENGEIFQDEGIFAMGRFDYIGMRKIKNDLEDQRDQL